MHSRTPMVWVCCSDQLGCVRSVVFSMGVIVARPQNRESHLTSEAHTIPSHFILATSLSIHAHKLFHHFRTNSEHPNHNSGAFLSHRSAPALDRDKHMIATTPQSTSRPPPSHSYSRLLQARRSSSQSITARSHRTTSSRPEYLSRFEKSTI